MICPSCKGENPAQAVRCGHCGTVLELPQVGDKPKPSSESRPSPRMDRQDDRTIDSAAPSGGSRSQDRPGVSILSKTPSGSVPMDDRTMDSVEPSALAGGDNASPASAGSKSQTRSRAGSGLNVSG